MDNTKQSIAEITKYKNKCIEIVQKLIDPVGEKLSKDEILGDCSYITRAHFDDICEERACSDLCAYVFCDKALSSSKENNFTKSQIYSIQKNRLYDIKRRKLFCSDLCFKSSDHLREQVSTEILSLRLKKVTISLYNANVGVRGDVVQLENEHLTEADLEAMQTEDRNPPKPRESSETLSMNRKENMIFKTKTRQDVLRKERQLQTKISAPYVQDSTFKELKEQFEGLDIKEKNVHNDFDTFMDALENNALNDVYTPKPESKQMYPININMNKNNPTSTMSSMSEKLEPVMDIPDSEVFSGQIKERNVEQLQAEVEQFSVTSCSDISGISTSSKVRKLKRYRFFLDTISKLKQWSTKKTKELLKCRKKERMEEGDNGHRGEKRMNESDSDEDGDEESDRQVYAEEDEQARLERYRWEYIQLTAKLDLEEAEEERLDQKLLAEGLPSDPKNKAKARNTKRKKEKKSVRFSVDETIFEEDNGDSISDKKDKKEEDKKEENADQENEEEKVPLFLPAKLRPEKERFRQFLREIEKVLFEIFDTNLDQSDLDKIRYHIKTLVQTFNFTNFPLLFDRKMTFMIVVILLQTLLKYDLLLQDEDNEDGQNREEEQKRLKAEFGEKINKNPVIVVFMQRFQLSKETFDENLERIWPQKAV